MSPSVCSPRSDLAMSWFHIATIRSPCASGSTGRTMNSVPAWKPATIAMPIASATRRHQRQPRILEEQPDTQLDVQPERAHPRQSLCGTCSLRAAASPLPAARGPRGAPLPASGRGGRRPLPPPRDGPPFPARNRRPARPDADCRAGARRACGTRRARSHSRSPAAAPGRSRRRCAPSSRPRLAAVSDRPW